MIGDCLASVSWADEIIVVDSGSSDSTADIARAHGARVIGTNDWPGFGVQKNRAVDAATGDWILSLDADERISPALRDEVSTLLAGGDDAEAYEIPRLSSYCGRFMRHGGWWPDYVTRLFQRGRARFSDDLVHERLIVEGRTGRLRNHLIHLTYENLEEVLDKVNRYSTAGAKMAYTNGRRGSLSVAIMRGLWAFIRTYFLRAGILDGRYGFMLAVSNAEATYYRYLKLMLFDKTK